MPDSSNLLTFALVALGMVLTPGPNMIYLVSRSISQGPKAGLISWRAWPWASSFTWAARPSASRRC